MKKKIVSLGLPLNSDDHQLIGSIIFSNFKEKYEWPYVYYEMGIISERERAPDLSFWREKIKFGVKKRNENLMLTIEIVHSRQNIKYSTESVLDVFDKIPTLNESFIYNYEKDLWTRFTREKDGILAEEGKDYSRVLKCYMHTLLK